MRVSSEWNDAPDDVEWNEWGPAVRVRVDHAPVVDEQIVSLYFPNG